jgi:hypothetical protein
MFTTHPFMKSLLLPFRFEFLVFGIFLFLAGGCGGSETSKPEDPDKFLTPQVLPQTGWGRSSTGSSSFGSISIQTRFGAGNLWVKIVEAYGSQRAVTVLFIRAGDSYMINLPSGTYRIKMASGDTWYGTKDLFGSKTSYSVADDTFPIARRGDSWTVQLIPQVNGNLQEKTISASDF